ASRPTCCSSSSTCSTARTRPRSDASRTWPSSRSASRRRSCPDERDSSGSGSSSSLLGFDQGDGMRSWPGTAQTSWLLLWLLAQSAAPPAAEIRTKVAEYMPAAVTVDGFSGTILVARDGQPIVSEGYGMANVELAVPNRPETVFRLGSITKQFT